MPNVKMKKTLFNDSTLGILGAAIILYAFLMNQTGRWKPTDFFYDLLNFIGSAILIFYSFFEGVYPFAILNTVWALVSLKDIAKSIGGNKNAE